MKLKLCFLFTLVSAMTINLISCGEENDVQPAELNLEELLKFNEDTTLAEALVIALQQTEDGYVPIVNPISAETFFQYFSKGGWCQSADYRVSPEGVVSGPYRVIGGTGTVLQDVSTTSLNDIGYGIGPNGDWRVGSERCACEYDEQTNTLTYGSRQFSVLSITDEEIRCTMPLDVGDYQLMSFSDVEPYVLKYVVFKNIPEDKMQQLLNQGS